MQPLVLMNRFIINLKSLDTPISSQGSSTRQHWSRFSAPNFHIPDSGSFLGNIGEDLQDGHEPADDDYGHHEMDAICLDTEDSSEVELEETSTTLGSSSSRPVDAQVSLQIHSESKRYERILFHLGWSPGQLLGLQNMS